MSASGPRVARAASPDRTGGEGLDQDGGGPPIPEDLHPRHQGHRRGGRTRGETEN